MISKTRLTELTKIQGVVNNLKNIGTIANGATGRLGPYAVSSLAAAIDGLSLKQAQLALSTKKLTQDQMNQVLVEAGLIASEDKIQAELLQSALSQANLSAERKKAILTELGLMNAETNELFIKEACTKEELLNMLATQGVTGANETAILSALGLAGANETATVSFGLFSAATWTQVKAQLALIASNPITWIVAVAGAIYGGVKAYNALTETEDEATEALENAKSVSDSYRSSINDVISSQNELASNTKNITERYAELSQGVDSMSNKNLSLSTDDYNEFLDLNSQLANLFPTLTKGYDENGNAILGLGRNIDTVTGKIQALAEQQERLASREILDNLENYVNGDDDGGGQLEEIKRLEKEKEKAEKLANTYGHFRDLFNGKTVSTQDLGINEISNIFDLAGVDYKNLDMNEKGWNISRLTPVELNKVKTVWGNYYQDIFSEAQTAKDELANANAEMSSEMMYWVQSLPQYKNSKDENIQTAMINLVNGIDWSSAGASDYESAKNVINQLVFTPLSELSNDSTSQNQFSSAISKLFSLNTADMPADEAEEIIQNYIQQIMDILNKFRDEEDKLSLDDTYSMFGFSNFMDNDKSFTNSLYKIAGSNTTDMQKLSDYTKDFTMSQQQAWMTATNGAKDAESAIEQYEKTFSTTESVSSSPLSFSEAWNNLGTTGTDDEKQAALEAKQELLELAKAGEISDTTLNSNENYKTLLEDTGLSAREARHEIMKMISEQEKMSGFQSQMDNMATLYNEFKDKGFVTAETLNGLPDVFKDMNGGTDFDLFSKIVGDPKSGTQKIKKAFNDIITAYIKDQDVLTGTTTDNKGTIIANLEDAGISNAKGIVNAYITSIKQIDAAEDEFFNQSDGKRSLDITNFQNALKDKNTSFSEACNILGTNNASLIYSLGEQYADDYTNWLELIDKKKEAYNTYVQALNNASPKKVAEQAKKGSEGASPSSIYMGLQSAYNSYKNISEEEEEAKNKITGYQTINLDFDPLEYKPKEPDTNENTTPKETKQSFDWLERKVSVLTSKLDLLKAKIENVFSVKKKNNIINDEIKSTNALIKTYQQQAKTYKAQAKKSAKSEETVTGNDKAKLTGKKGKKLKKQIQTGQIKGSKKQWIQKYGESTANAIEEYQDYWDKYQESHVNIQSARTTRRELKIQKHQNIVDKYDAQSNKYDAQIKNAATAEAKKNLENKKITSTKKSYNQQIKIAELKYKKKSPQVAKLKAEKKTAVRDIKIEKYQNFQDEADSQRDLLDAKIESADTVGDKNSYLQQQQAYITSSYNAQIKIADLEGNTAKKEELKIKKQQELLENEKQQLQNLSDEQSALYELNQLRESSAKSAKEKNVFEADSRENLKAQYRYEIEIAKKNGDKTEADRLQLELNQKIEESYQRQIENLKEEYDLTIGLNDAKKSTIDSQIAALQANGYGVTAELYKEQQGIALENYQNTLSKISDITTEMQNLDPKSQAYKNYSIELESCKQEAWGYQQAWAETQQAINDINLSKIEHIGTLLGYQANQLEHIQNILGHSDFTLSAEDGSGLTMEGLANVAVTFRQMQNNNEQIANKKDQIAEIRRQIDEKEYVGTQEQAEEELYTLLREIEELEESNYTFGESIKTMVIDSLNSLSDALDENISKCKDSLKVQKDIFDYRKKVVNQLKSITSLEKQLAALEGSNTEEARARIQKLQIQLEEEQENLNEIEYDKYIQDQEELLDKVSEEFQDFIANVTDASVAKICETMSKVVTDNLDEISKTITNLFVESASVGAIADSITDLKNVMENIDFNTKITLNINSNGVPTSMNIDDKEVTVAKSDNGMSDTANDIENASADNGNAELKQSIGRYIEKLNNYVSDSDAGMSLSIDPLNQFLYTKHGKMATAFEKFQIIKRLDLLQNGWGDEKNPEILMQAVEKLQQLGFSHGGIATHLNKIALANGDDGWATLKRGESVLTPAQTEQFQRLTENLVPLNTIAESVTSLPSNPAPVNHSPASTTTIRNMDIHLDGSHVMDTDTFIQTLHNPRVLQEVSSGVSSQLGNVLSNKLGKF